jgi:Aminoacyl-tRNA editing domain
MEEQQSIFGSKKATKPRGQGGPRLPPTPEAATNSPSPNPVFLMPVSPEDLLAYLAALGIETETVDHPPLFTVEDSQALRGEIVGAHTKNLFVKDKKGRLFLLVLGEETLIDLKRVHETIGAQGRVSFGSLISWKRCGAFGRARSRPLARSTMRRPGFPWCWMKR